MNVRSSPPALRDRLKERLETIASRMDESPDYTPTEAYVWRLLAAYVDRERFERTGQIVTVELTMENLAPEQNSAAARAALVELEYALAALVEKKHVAVLDKPGAYDPHGPVRYRLLLNQPAAVRSDY